LTSVSCASAGNCTAVGNYVDSTRDSEQGLLLTETSTWAAGVEAVLPAGAGPSPELLLESVSCASAGNCTAAGYYGDDLGQSPGLLLTETSGTWATGVEPPLPANSATSPDVYLNSVSCAPAGSCAAVGLYADSSGNAQGLLLSQAPAAQATTTALASSADPSAARAQVTYTVTVSPAPDSGTVSFTDNGSPIAGCGRLPAGRRRYRPGQLHHYSGRGRCA
jgi:hypothetical protein